MISKKSLCLSIALAGTCSVVLASENSDEYREHGAHEHGAAEMSVALIDGELTLNLSTPSYNILGFEHAPSTDEQIAHVEQQFAQLEKAQALFAIPKSAACALQKFELDNPFEEHEESDEHAEDEKHAKDDHEHEHNEHAEDEKHAESDHEHKHDEHDEHAEDEHEHEEGETHSDIQVSYHYSCEDLTALDNLDMSGLFEHFTNLTELDIAWLNAETQSAATLTPENTRLTLE